jgi:hypothetical protein
VNPAPDFDVGWGDGPDALTRVVACQAGDSDVGFREGAVRLSVFSGSRNLYSNAQMDDYRQLPRARFPNRAPLTLSVRARFSHEAKREIGGAGLAGTAGFGFWNDPFAMSGAYAPALPAAAWFFYASPPSDMKLDHATPGWGWKAATMDARRPEAIPPALAAPLLIPLMRSQRIYRRVWPRIQAALCVREALVSGPMTEWRDYRLEWGVARARFFVDAALILDAPAPRGPLGFVIWCDNQYLIATPQGRLGHGTLPASEQYLEFSRLQIQPPRHLADSVFN